MQIPIEINDEIIAMIDEIAQLTGLTREQIVENNLRKILAEDQERIKQRQSIENDLKTKK